MTAKRAAQELPLKQVVSRSLVIAYRENVDELMAVLQREGLNPTVARAAYTEEEARYTNQYKCFMGHRDAWRHAAKSDGYTLVCEADFVPCAGLGRLPVFWPVDRSMAWGYLYQGSPRLLWLTPDGYLRGHAAPTVAYVINREVARILLQFFDYEMQRHKATEYFTFEAHLQWWAMSQGAEAFIPLRHYGEHGGRPQPEHRLLGRNRSVVHRADNLAAPLSFLPQYADSSYRRYLAVRMAARLKGWGRFISRRWIVDTDVYTRTSLDTLRMVNVGLVRLCPGRIATVRYIGDEQDE
jgi:hypothetical protein